MTGRCGWPVGTQHPWVDDDEHRPLGAIEGSLALSYLGVRRAIGVIGILLPFVLLIGAWLIDRVGVQASISDYYYTVMRNVFVGSMCANGVFFLSYRYAKVDTVVSSLIGLAAIGVALFPTTPVNPTPTEMAVGSSAFRLRDGVLPGAGGVFATSSSPGPIPASR